VFDRFGTYMPVFWVCLALSVVAVGAMARMLRLLRPVQKPI
jgi:hypothetical protein